MNFFSNWKYIFESSVKPYKAIAIGIIYLLSLCYNTLALTPNEVVLLVNSNSLDSIGLANIYSELRGIPSRNIVPLDIPSAYANPERLITRKKFQEVLWEPFIQALEERGITDSVQAVLLSSDFPIAVSGRPATSVQAGFFFRNQWPSDTLIKSGNGCSPFFSGEVQGQSLWKGTFSLDRYIRGSATPLPLPTGTIAYVGARGNTSSELVSMYQRSVASDFSNPVSGVYFVEVKDVRSTAREWQYPWAVDKVSRPAIAKVQGSNNIRGNNAIGIMTGLPNVPSKMKNSLIPGSLAGHLTSWGATFSRAPQTKITEWVSAGASGTYGTVTEPYAVWTKFPHASLFLHYTAGASMLESYYQAISMPVQGFVYGDAFARPFAPRIKVKLATKVLENMVLVKAQSSGQPTDLNKYYKVLVNGKIFADESQVSQWEIPLKGAAPMVVRVYALTDGPIGFYGYADKDCSEYIQQVVPSLTTSMHDEHSVNVRLALTSEKPIKFSRLIKWNEEVGRINKGESFSIAKESLGYGPSYLSAQGEYLDGGVFRSNTVRVQIEKPLLEEGSVAQGLKSEEESGSNSWSRIIWGSRWTPEETTHSNSASYTMRAEEGFRTVDVKISQEVVKGFLIEAEWLDGEGFINGGKFGLIFNRSSKDTFACLYVDGKTSSLVLAEVTNGVWNPRRVAGYPFKHMTPFLMHIEQVSGGLVCGLNGQKIFDFPGGSLGDSEQALGISGQNSVSVHHVISTLEAPKQTANMACWLGQGDYFLENISDD